jgi:phage FluMu gp28-like protein
MNIDLPIKNFPKQQSIFDSKAKYKIAVKGRRFGLTKGAANDFIKCALEGKFKKGLWVDVVNSNIDRYIERYFLPHLNKLPKNMWDYRKQSKMVVINGAYIDFRSAEHPETLEGFGYDKAFLNEAGIILKKEYLWHNAIQPMFWDFPDVKVVIGGTPKGGRSLFEKLANMGDDPTQSAYQTFHFTSFDSPFAHIHKAIEEDLKTMPQRVIEQEIYAKFLEDTGVVFRNFLEVMDATPQRPQKGHRYIIGVDLAKVEDFTVLAVYDAANNRQVYQARFNQLDWGMQKSRIAETSKHFGDGEGPAAVVIDATGLGDPIVDDLARMGIPVDPIKFTNDQKRQMIEKLANWIELKRLHMLPIEETKNELANFTYDISELTDRVRYGAPTGFHDDIVIAHALAVWRLDVNLKEATEKPKTLIQEHYEKTKLKADEEDITIDGYPEEFNEWGQY